jgi:hypothetical protein
LLPSSAPLHTEFTRSLNSVKKPQDFAWPFWPVVPLYPYGQRRTLRQEVLKDTIWTFEQLQGILYVVVPIRMTVIKMASGGLLVYAPVAPTPECIRLVRELVAEHGEVRYIILPTVSGIEHKVFVGPFARQFPTAQVYVAPHQWSYPLNLPLSWLGLPAKRTHILPLDSQQTPFGDEFDYAILEPIDLGLGPFVEVAFCHRRSRTLLVTDSLISIPEHPPAIISLDPYPLLFHARDRGSDRCEDTPENRLKGWQRICLFAFYFRPSAMEPMPLLSSLWAARESSDRSKKAYFGWFPFQWQLNWQESFKALRGDGRLLVAPILQQLILNRAPKETLAWVEQVMNWDCQHLIACHLDAPVKFSPQELRQAFSFLEQHPQAKNELQPQALPEADFQLLKQLDQGLYCRGITPPAKNKV